jgi:hypothetical protein
MVQVNSQKYEHIQKNFFKFLIAKLNQLMADHHQPILFCTKLHQIATLLQIFLSQNWNNFPYLDLFGLKFISS